MIANINIKNVFRILILTISVLGLSYYQGLTQDYNVYRYPAGQQNADGSYIPAHSIPASLPESNSIRLIYILSANIGEYDNYSYSEYFTNQNPINYFDYDSPVSESHYFALVDENIDLSTISFRTNFYVNNNSHVGGRNPVTPYDEDVGEMHELNDHDGFNGYINKMWVGVSPPNPKNFSIQSQDSEGNWENVSMVTEGETIRFNMSADDYSKFNIERSLDEGNTWTKIKTNVSSGNTTPVGSVPNGETSFDVRYRVRTYAGSNAVVGQSYGYNDFQLIVVSKPEFNIDASYTVCCGDELNGIVIDNISAPQNIHQIRVQLFNLDNYPNNPIVSDTITKDASQYTFDFEPPLGKGEYKVKLFNILLDENDQLYPLGETSKNFSVIEREPLSSFIEIPDQKECQSGADTFNFKKKDFPSYVAGKYTTNDTTVEFDSSWDGNVTVYGYNDTIVIELWDNEIGCSFISDTLSNLFVRPKISFTTEVSQPICSYDNAIVELKNVFPNENHPLEYAVYRKQLLDEFIPSSDEWEYSGNYSGKFMVKVRYTNEPHCSATNEITIDPRPKEIFFETEVQNVIGCDNAKNGSIKVSNIANAVDPLMLFLYIKVKNEYRKIDSIPSNFFGISIYTFKNLTKGDYKIVLRDRNGCEKPIENLIVGGPDYPFVVDYDSINPCNNPNNNGSITLKPQGGGVSTYHIQEGENWVGITNPETYPDLTAEKYTFYVRANNDKNCIERVSVTLEEKEPFSIDTVNVLHPTCSESKGSITLGNADIFEYKNGINWEPYANDDNRQFGEGTHIFRGKTGTCYSDELEVTIEAIPDIKITNPSTTQPTCNGELGEYHFSISEGTESDYSIELDGNLLTNVVSDYDQYYSFNNENGTYTIHNLSGREEEYILIVTNGTLCSASTSFKITDPPAIDIGYSIVEPIKCFGEQSKVLFTADEGTPPYTFDVYEDTYQNVNDSLNVWLNYGNYTFNVTDSNGCESTTLDFEINQPDSLSFEITSSTNPSCSGHYDGEIEVKASGGVAPYIIFVNDTEGVYNLNSLEAGVYFLHIIDKNGCRFPNEEGSYLIDTLSAPNPMAIFIDNIAMPACHGRSDGSITVTLSGRDEEDKLVELLQGETILDSYSGNLDEITFSDLPAGSYAIKFTEESGVCSVTKDVIIGQPNELTYSLTPINASCLNSSTGEVEVSDIGGNAPYTVTLLDLENDSSLVETQNGSTLFFTFENLYASGYGINLVDNNECPVSHPTDSVAVVANPPLALDLQLQQQPADCFGTETGQVTAEASGGWGSYSFSLDASNWFDAENSYLFTDLGAMSHTVYLRDTMNCVVEQSIEVEQPLELTIDSVVVESVMCYGGSDGTIEVFASGGNGGYEYSFGDDFVNHSKQINLTYGEYSVTVRDAKGCEAEQQVPVPQPQEFSLEIVKNTYHGGFNISCHGLTDTVRLTPTGATAPYSIYLNNNLIGNTNAGELFSIDALAAGTHQVRVVDANECEYSYEFILEQPDSLSFDEIITTQPKCHSGTDGSIEIKTFSGGSGLYSFELLLNEEVIQAANNITSFKFEGLASGSYVILASDSNGCAEETSIDIEQPTPVVVSELTSNPLQCKGNNSGSILVSVEGGVGSYQYQWYNATNELISTVNPLEEQPAGIYTLRVSDGNGCWAINSETGDSIFSESIEEPAEQLIIESFTSTQTTCHGSNNGEISVTSSGGWGSNHSYSLNGGSYSPNNQFKNLTAKNYVVSVRDSMGCTFEESITVTQPDELILGFESIVDVDCHNNSTGEVILSASGGNSGYAYGFSQATLDSSPTFSNLSAGSYTFWVEDSKECVASTTIQISQPEPMEFTAINVQYPQCGASDGSFDILPLGGSAPFSIEWTSHSLPNNLQVSNVDADFYHFTLTDSMGCSSNFSLALNTTNEPTISSINLTEPTCHYRSDGAIEVSLEGDVSVESIIMSNDDGQTWEGASRVENLPKNTYYLRAMDSDGCIALSSVQLDAPQPMMVNMSVLPAKCLDDDSGSASITVSGGTAPYNGVWYNDSHNPVATGLETQGLAVGSYYASITDANGCGLTSDVENNTPSIEVTEPEEPLSLSVEQINSPICAGGSNGQISLAADGGWGGYQFYVNDTSPSSNPTLSNLVAGSYEASVIDLHGCKVTQMVTVTDPPPVIANVTQTHHVKCAGGNDGSIWVSAENGLSPYSYSINNGESWNNHGVFNNLTEGDYTIIARDIDSCVGSTLVSLTQPDSLQVSPASLLPTYCGANNGEISLAVEGGVGPYTIQWNHLTEPSGLTISNLHAGIYTANLTDANQCATQIALEVPEVDGPRIISYNYIPPMCHDSSDGQVSIDFTGVSSPFRFFLNDQQVESSEIDSIAKGNYQFAVVDEFSCADTLLFTIDGPQPISIEFDNIVHPLCFDYSNGSLNALATGGTPPYSFEWSHGSTGNGVENLSAGAYSALVTDNHGCIEESTVEINNPAPIQTNLPEFVALCQGQSVTLDPQNPDCMHWWESSNGFESFQQVVTLWEAGEYYLLVTNENGCFVNDTVTVNQYDYEVNSTILVPNQASVGDTIVVIDISWPVPDYISWEIPSEFTILVDNPYEKQLIPIAEGVFTIGLTSTTGECSAYMEKAISVSGFAQPILPKGEDHVSIIRSMALAPNPAQRNTTVEVDLMEKANITIELVNSFGLRTKRINLGGADRYSYQLPLYNIPPGIYLVKVMANGHQKAVRLIVL